MTADVRRKLLVVLVAAAVLFGLDGSILGAADSDPATQEGSEPAPPADPTTTTAPGDDEGSTTSAPAEEEPVEEDEEDAEEPARVFGKAVEISGDGTRAPVEGAEFSAVDESGGVAGTATSDASGDWEIELPVGGTYRIELDLESLPDGVGLTDDEAGVEGDVAFRTITLNDGASRPAIFQLGEGVTRSDSLTRRIAQRTVDGLQFGLLIAMGAIGLSLIYGTTGLVNFAHGELVTWGAIVAFWANTSLFGGMHVVPATVIAGVVGGLLGYLIDRGMFRPLRNRGASLVAQLVITIGLSFFLRNFFQYLFGERPQAMRFGASRDIEIWIVSMNPLGLTIIAVTTAILVAVGLALQLTRVGKAMRAVADNRDLAESSGIDVQRVISLVWFFGGALAAMAGAMLAMDERATFDIGFRLLLLIFAGVTLGGLGTAFGALIGSVIVGIFINVSTIILPNNLKNVGALLVLILILMIRPQGILGRAERIG